MKTKRLLMVVFFAALGMASALGYNAGVKHGTKTAFDHSVFPAGCKPKPSPTGTGSP